MIHSTIPVTEYTGTIDSRFHDRVSKQIADPDYRHKFYTIDGFHGTPDGSDMRILCLCFISRSDGGAKIRGIIMVRNDPCVDMLAIAALRLVAAQELPLYATANVVIVYGADGCENAMPMTDYLRGIADRLGVTIETLKNSTGEIAAAVAHKID